MQQPPYANVKNIRRFVLAIELTGGHKLYFLEVFHLMATGMYQRDGS